MPNDGVQIGNSNEDSLVHFARPSPVRCFGRIRGAHFTAVRTYLPREASERMVGAILPDDRTLVHVRNLADADKRGMESGVHGGQSRDSSDGDKCPSRSAADGFKQGLGVESKSKRSYRQMPTSKPSSEGSRDVVGGLPIPGSPERRRWF